MSRQVSNQTFLPPYGVPDGYPYSYPLHLPYGYVVSPLLINFNMFDPQFNLFHHNTVPCYDGFAKFLGQRCICARPIPEDDTTLSQVLIFQILNSNLDESNRTLAFEMVNEMISEKRMWLFILSVFLVCIFILPLSCTIIGFSIMILLINWMIFVVMALICVALAIYVYFCSSKLKRKETENLKLLANTNQQRIISNQNG
jgi:hypothetical protein